MTEAYDGDYFAPEGWSYPTIDEQKEVWAVWSHPIIRQLSEPVPVLATGTRDEMEAKFYDLCEREDVDEFYLELGPLKEGPR